MTLARWKVWFRNRPLDKAPDDAVTFAIEFNVPSYHENQLELILDAAEILADRLNISMAGSAEKM